MSKKFSKLFPHNILHFLQTFWSKRKVSAKLSVFKNGHFCFFAEILKDYFANSPPPHTVSSFLTFILFPRNSFLKNIWCLEFIQKTFLSYNTKSSKTKTQFNKRKNFFIPPKRKKYPKKETTFSANPIFHGQKICFAKKCFHREK